MLLTVAEDVCFRAVVVYLRSVFTHISVTGPNPVSAITISGEVETGAITIEWTAPPGMNYEGFRVSVRTGMFNRIQSSSLETARDPFE